MDAESINLGEQEIHATLLLNRGVKVEVLALFVGFYFSKHCVVPKDLARIRVTNCLFQGTQIFRNLNPTSGCRIFRLSCLLAPSHNDMREKRFKDKPYFSMNSSCYCNLKPAKKSSISEVVGIALCIFQECRFAASKYVGRVVDPRVGMTRG